MHGIIIQFTERYAWNNNTVHRVSWEGTVLRVVENGTVYKVNLQVFKSGLSRLCVCTR